MTGNQLAPSQQGCQTAQSNPKGKTACARRQVKGDPSAEKYDVARNYQPGKTSVRNPYRKLWEDKGLIGQMSPRKPAFYPI